MIELLNSVCYFPTVLIMRIANKQQLYQFISAALLPIFPKGTKTEVSSIDTLIFKGPLPSQKKVGAHVALSLEADLVSHILEEALDDRQQEHLVTLQENLATQIHSQYNPNRVGCFALRISGTKTILD